MEYSITQAGNLTVVAGLVVMVARMFHVQLAQDEVVQALTAGVMLVGLCFSWYGRWRRGDLTVSGFRK